MKNNKVVALAALAALAGACKSEPNGPEIDACSGNPFTPVALAEGTADLDPGATADQLGVIEYVNGFRRSAGAGPVNLSAEIDAAATSHALYFVTNPAAYAGGLSPHQEAPGYPGFTGVNFWDRMDAAGYAGGFPSFEVMHFINSPLDAVDGWVNSVYHRPPFLSPAMLDLGYGGESGAGGSADVIDFGCCSSTADLNATILFPYHDQTGYPTRFDGNEGPPPPPPPTGWPSGSMVSISFHPDTSVTITSHEIFDASCGLVEHVASAGPGAEPGLDQGLLAGMFLMYPNRPLAPLATYTVNVEGTLGGTPFVRTWRFTTGS